MDLEDDDWLFESIKKYKNISMYDLQKRITAMDWVERQGLVVATSDGIKHEILELKLPDKLLSEQSSQGLKKDRDFRVNTGGFCNSCITAIKHIPKTRRCISAHEDREGLTIWNMGDSDTDLITPQDRIKCRKPSRCDLQFDMSMEGQEGCVTYGSNLDNITTVDLNTKNGLHDFIDLKEGHNLSALHHLNKHTVITCTETGDVSILDLRSKKVKVRNCSCKGSTASFWILDKASLTENQSETVLQMSSSGEILFLDIRCMDESVVKMQTSFKTENVSNFSFLSIKNNSHRSSKPCISISGFDNTVALFDQGHLTDPDRNTGGSTIEPFFIHTGHSLGTCNHDDIPSCTVSCHMWHPWQQDLVLSADTAGSLHAWQYSPDFIKENNSLSL